VCRLSEAQLARLRAGLDRGPAAWGCGEDQRWTLARVTVLIGRLLLLHTIGRRTGQERIIPLVYTTVNGSYVVAGSNGGAEKEPLWVANVEVKPEVTIEVGEVTMTAKPSVLREGAEREQLYAALVAYWPDFVSYEASTSRHFR
jgi:deazaflavin-dependent oxidoreductase (nitroreductase family)